MHFRSVEKISISLLFTHFLYCTSKFVHAHAHIDSMRDDDEPTVLVVELLPCRRRREGGITEDFRRSGT